MAVSININRSYLSDFVELTKPRICCLALFMASLGYLLGAKEFSVVWNWVNYIWALVGLSLIGFSSGALNQLVEKDVDSRMWRTLQRPLPSGRLSEKEVRLFGIVTAFLGEFILLIFVNPMTAVLGVLSLWLYVGIYTPAKKLSSMSTIIGAIPGALPPLMGWTAATGIVSRTGILLFTILFLWQIPHFLAIAWMYREDYARADIPVLGVIDEDCRATFLQSLLYALALMLISLVPYGWEMTGEAYFFGALVLGGLFLFFIFQLGIKKSFQSARGLFFYSLIYLPLLGIIWVWDRIN